MNIPYLSSPSGKTGHTKKQRRKKKKETKVGEGTPQLRVAGQKYAQVIVDPLELQARFTVRVKALGKRNQNRVKKPHWKKRKKGNDPPWTRKGGKETKRSVEPQSVGGDNQT